MFVERRLQDRRVPRASNTALVMVSMMMMMIVLVMVMMASYTALVMVSIMMMMITPNMLVVKIDNDGDDDDNVYFHIKEVRLVVRRCLVTSLSQVGWVLNRPAPTVQRMDLMVLMSMLFHQRVLLYFEKPPSHTCLYQSCSLGLDLERELCLEVERLFPLGSPENCLKISVFWIVRSRKVAWSRSGRETPGRS